MRFLTLFAETSSLSNKAADKKRQTIGLESELGELKIQLDVAEREESALFDKCEALETETKELKKKLKYSESEVNKLSIHCKNLEEQLELSRTLKDTNLESPSHHKNDTPASELRKSSLQGRKESSQCLKPFLTFSIVVTARSSQKPHPKINL